MHLGKSTLCNRHVSSSRLADPVSFIIQKHICSDAKVQHKLVPAWKTGILSSTPKVSNSRLNIMPIDLKLLGSFIYIVRLVRCLL